MSSNQTIGDIYAANEQIREKTKKLIENLSEENASFLPDGEKWTIKEIVEHIAIVQNGMAKISAKLLKEAEAAGKKSDGAARLSENFAVKAAEARQLKFDAPDRVLPTGKQSIEESLTKMDAAQIALEDLRPLFETVDCSDFKFPHPFMGDLTAHEWLALVGGHESRHQRQIEARLNKE